MTSGSDWVDQEAADWVVRLGEPETDRRSSKQQFLHWLMLSPEHKKAFTQTVCVSRVLSNLDRSRRIDVQELIRRGSPKVIELSPAVSPLAAGGVRSLAHWLRRRAAVLAILLCMVSVALFYSLIATHYYATAIGELRTVTLQDGSIVTLFSQTRLATRFSAGLRYIQMLEGEAVFVVKHDDARPFQVVSDGTVVRDIGTEFEISRHQRNTNVMVIQGEVQISVTNDAILARAPTLATTLGHANQTAASQYWLESGDVMTIDRSRATANVITSRTSVVEIAHTHTWRRRQVSFNGEGMYVSTPGLH